MRTTTVEHETEDKAQARAAESQRQDGAPPVAELANAPPALLHPRQLLGLQAMAGNAAVAGLIARSHKPEPVQAPEPPTPAATSVEGVTPAGGSEAPAIEDTTAAPRAGETDEELAQLDTAADAPPVGAQPEPASERELVAHDAQAELAEEAGQFGGEAETNGGGTEPGNPIEVRPPPTIPDLSGAEPAAGLARVGGLPPGQLLSSLGSVSGAVDRQAADEHQQLAVNPPQRLRHPGAPSTVETPASSRITLAGRAAGSITQVAEGRDVDVVHPAAPPVVPEVLMPNGQLPTRDPGLELKPGALPHLPLEGSADPAAVQQQRGHLLAGLEREHTSGQREAGQPLGEDEIFPTAPAETLRAAVAQAPGANGQSAAPSAADDDQPASIIAEQEKGGEIQGAVSAGLLSLAGQRQDYAQRTAGERAKADAEMTQLEQANTREQAGERAVAKQEVSGLRGQWSQAQQELVAGAQREAEAKTGETLQTVAQERGVAEQLATAHYQKGQEKPTRRGAKANSKRQPSGRRRRARVPEGCWAPSDQ